MRNAQDYFERGNVYQAQGKHKEALGDYNKALELDPKYATAYYNRGNLYRAQGKHEEALGDYNQAIELGYDNAYIYRAILYQEQGEDAKALADYNKVLPSPHRNLLSSAVIEYGKGFYNRGLLYERQGRYDSALQDYSSAIGYEPNNAAAYINRGNVYQAQGKYEEARGDYHRALALNPEQAFSWLGLENNYREWTSKQDQNEKAKELWEEAKNFAEAKLQAGINQAQSLYQRAVEETQNLNIIQEKKEMLEQVLKKELYEGFERIADEFKKEEEAALEYIKKIFAKNLWVIIPALIVLVLLLLIIDRGSYLLLAPLYTMFIYWVFLYSNRYFTAKRKRQYYQHKSLVAKHMPVMLEHYQQTEQQQFVQELHHNLYELRDEKLSLKLKVKDWVQAELERFTEKKDQAK